MARSQGIAVNNSVAKGLITESSALNFPKDACIETYDCVHDVDGSVYRRDGFKIETNYSTRTINKTDKVINTYFWKDVAGDGDLTFVVVQVGSTLYFYDANIIDPYDGSPTDPISGHPISATINLASFSPSGAPSPATADCQFAAGNGKLYGTHPYLNPFYVSFDPDTSTFTSGSIVLKIRDLEGVSDGLGIDQRPNVGMGGISSEHHYNLLNQGWSDTNLLTWDGARSDLPSNADVMWRFKNTSDAFDPSTVPNVVGGNSPAAKGHYILSAFDKQRDQASGLAIADQTASYQRPSCIAFFAGRLFYAGTNYEGYNSKIYFSQIIERDEQFGWCYQINDPTSETLFDLLPSDGGVIDIQEAGTIIKLVVVPGGLIVFASNGVWMLTGSTGLGFTATDYTQTKIDSVSSVSASSFVDLGGLPSWWNLEGIYRLEAGQGGAFRAVSMTDQTIKKEYDDIPPSEKRNARGFYNPITRTVQWLYRSSEAADLKTYYEYDRILNFGIRTGGFYIWTIPVDDVKVHGIFVIENRGGTAALENVTQNSTANVTDNLGNIVQTWTIGDAIVIPKFKYVISFNDGADKLTFGEASDNVHYKDWYDFGSDVDYESYFITGYSLQNAMTDFQSNYVTFYVDNETTVDVQGLWDFSNSGNSGRWSTPQRIDSTDEDYYDYIPYRRKIRGSGKAVQLKVKSVTGKPFKISGWSVFVTGNQTP